MIRLSTIQVALWGFPKSVLYRWGSAIMEAFAASAIEVAIATGPYQEY